MSLRSWAHRLEAGLERIGAAVVREVKAVATAVETAVVGALQTTFGADIKTLTNPNASVIDRVLAGVDIASNVAGTNGVALGKSLLVTAEHAAEHKLEGDALKAAESGAFGKDVATTISLAEKLLEEIDVARGAIGSAESVAADGKSVTADVRALLAATSPADRSAALAKVATDVKKGQADVATTIADLTKGSENTALANALDLKSNGMVLTEGAALVVAALTGKTFAADALAALDKLQTEATARGKSLVVLDPAVTPEQQTALLAKGIAVAKSPADLASLAIASHQPGGVDRFNAAIGPANGTIPPELGLAAQGAPHPEAIPYKNGQRWEGRITAVGTDGSFEIKCGRQFVSFSSDQASELGIDRRQLQAGSYLDIVRPDPALPPRADIAADYRTLQQRNPDDREGLSTR